MKNNPLTLFYGYTAEQLTTWCGITKTYAVELKKGTRKPSKRITRLFLYHINQRLLGKEWIGWRVYGDRLYSPEGWYLTPGEIRALPYLVQLHEELTRGLQDGVKVARVGLHTVASQKCSAQG